MEIKKRFNNETINLPAHNQKANLDVSSLDNRESFIVDIDRNGKIELKSKIQERYNNNQILIRVEINGPPHTNPDGTTISRNHIHIYKEGYELSWAYELKDFSDDLFIELKNFNNVFTDFCSYCNIELNNNFQMVI